MAESLRGMLPPVYHHLFADFFDRPKVVETRATCDHCSMCDHGQPAPVPMEYFNPETKCCTFFPNLPNYLVGAILADPAEDMAEGKRRIREVIAKRIGVLPMYLSRPRKLTLVMSAYGDAFGRARSLLCPYYDGSNPAGSCTIWRHRENVCLTYYCKYTGGQRGYDFWAALKDYLGVVQITLARHTMTTVDPAVTQPVFKEKVLSVEDIDGVPPNPAEYERWWRSWVGREEEFYVKCFEAAAKETRDLFARNVDAKPAREALATLISSYEKHENKILPERLVRNMRMKEQHTGDKIVVTTYHRYDSFALDKELYEVIGLFKSTESLEENLERLRREHEIELAPELVEYLFAQGILVEPGNVNAKPKVKPEDEAEMKGRRAALGAILRARGVHVDDDARARIDAADLAALDGWIRKAANATRAADVFGADGKSKPRPGADARSKRRK